MWWAEKSFNFMNSNGLVTVKSIIGTVLAEGTVFYF